MLKRICTIFMVMILFGSLLNIGCAEEKELIAAQDGDVIKVHYTGTLKDGTIFDTSRGRQPLEFTLGAGQLIPGFENAVRGMSIGQSKTVTIPPEEAYGPFRDDLIFTIDKGRLPDSSNPEIGQQLKIELSGNISTQAIITDVSETTITVDANHHLAGKDLTFEIEVVEIR